MTALLVSDDTELWFEPVETIWRGDGKWRNWTVEHGPEQPVPMNFYRQADKAPPELLPAGPEDHWYFERGRSYPIGVALAEALMAAGFTRWIQRRAIPIGNRARVHASVPSLNDALRRIAVLEGLVADLQGAVAAQSEEIRLLSEAKSRR